LFSHCSWARARSKWPALPHTSEQTPLSLFGL
jgi:hypothetical protein